MLTHHVIVTALPLAVSGPELSAFVAGVVPVAAVEVEVDPVTSRSLGSAVLSFESVTDATRAVKELAGKPLRGQILHMEYATPETLAKARETL